MNDIKKLDCTSLHNELDEIASTLLFQFNDEYIRHIKEWTKLRSTDGFSELQDRFSKLFIILFNNLDENYLWQFCPYDVYKANFEQRRLIFFEENQYVTIHDFCEKEIRDFNVCERPDPLLMTPQMKYKFVLREIEYQLELRIIFTSEIYDRIYFSQRKKIEYLTEMMNGRQNHEIVVDFSDNSDAEKIVFLHELGILDFLRTKEPFNTTTNKLAQAISAFTGIKQTTAQSYLNPIVSKDFSARNNPLTEKNLQIVTRKLMKMGHITKNNNPLQST